MAYEAGDVIQIELSGGRQIEAEVVSYTKDEVVVKNTRNLKTGKIRKHNQTFFRSEVLEIIIIEKVNATAGEDDEDSGTNNNATQNEHAGNIIRSNVQKREFSERELATIQSLTKNAVHIAQFDDDYHSAVADLIQQDIVFVNYESMFGRLDPKRSVLTIATPSKVYLFDMLRLGAMKKEMKDVFSSAWPRKVVHSTAEFADYLKNKENCTLNGAFDTLMVHYNLKKTREHITLQKCFEEYIDLPDDFVLQEQNFNIRPLEVDALVRATLTSILLMKLYWHMNDILMKPLHIATTNFAELYQRVDDQVDLMVLVNAGKYPGVENIELNATEQLEEAFDQSVDLLVDLNN